MVEVVAGDRGSALFGAGVAGLEAAGAGRGATAGETEPEDELEPESPPAASPPTKPAPASSVAAPATIVATLAGLCREGLSVLVVDQEHVLKRIARYSHRQLILEKGRFVTESAWAVGADVLTG